MSIIFAPTIHQTGLVSLAIGGGPIVTPIVACQSLLLDDAGAIYAAFGTAIDHYAQGLPFDIDGRLIFSANAVDHVDQGIPFSAQGHVVFGGATSYYNQGVPYGATGQLALS